MKFVTNNFLDRISAKNRILPVDDDMFDSVEVFLFLDSHNVIECLLRIFSVVNLARSLATESKKKFSH